VDDAEDERRVSDGRAQGSRHVEAAGVPSGLVDVAGRGDDRREADRDIRIETSTRTSR